MIEIDKQKSTFRNTLAIVFSVFLTICLILSVFAVAIDKVLLNPESYRQAFVDQEFYDRLPEIVVSQFTSDTEQNTQISLLRFSPDHLQNLMSLVFEEPQARDQYNRIFDQFWRLVTLQEGQRTMSYNMTTIKQSFYGDVGERILRGFIKTLPRCTENELFQVLQYNPNDAGSELPLCRFSDQVTNFILPVIQSIVRSSFSILPEQITILALDAEEPALIHIPEIYGKLYTGIRQAIVLIPIISLLCLIVLLVLAAPKVKDRLKVISIPLLCGGLTSLILTTVLFFLLNSVILDSIRQGLINYSMTFVSTIEEIIRQIGTSFILTTSLTGFAVFSAGVISWTASQLQSSKT
jgi:hypothetical protein